MALSFKEKRKIQSTIKSALGDLGKEGVSFKEKHSLQKTISQGLAALKVVVKEAASRLDRLLAGDFLNLDPVPFIDLVEEMEASEEVSLDQAKSSILAYYEKNLATP